MLLTLKDHRHISAMLNDNHVYNMSFALKKGRFSSVMVRIIRLYLNII